MNPLVRGLVIALTQVLLVVGVGGKLLYDRRTLPSAWAPTTGVDPYLPIRGRYVSLRLVVQPDPATEPRGESAEPGSFAQAELAVADGALRARFVEDAGETFLGWEGQTLQRVATRSGLVWALAEPIAFFLPEAGPDPTLLGEGEVLWAQVTVPPAGVPRPIRLEVR